MNLSYIKVKNNENKFLNKLEDYTETVTKYCKNILPHIARLCLISTFIDDGYRMASQFESQSGYTSRLWNLDLIFGKVFIVYNMIFQLVPCALVLARRQLNWACFFLFTNVIIQTIVYKTMMDKQYLLRNIALCGGILLLLVESRPNTKNMFAGVPILHNNKPKTYMQFLGRLLLLIMFFSLIRIDYDILHVITNVFGTILILCVAIGYKTKLSALSLVMILATVNVLAYPFWTLPSNKHLHDFYKYSFFQTFSVIGGLLYVVALGPGDVSLDEHKKRW